MNEPYRRICHLRVVRSHVIHTFGAGLTLMQQIPLWMLISFLNVETSDMPVPLAGQSSDCMWSLPEVAATVRGFRY
jgi:hypothetical protein